MKKRGVERRVRMGLETRDRVGWWERGMRAMQFRATSSGRDGIRLFGGVVVGASASSSEGQGLHMASVAVECYFPNTTSLPLFFFFSSQWPPFLTMTIKFFIILFIFIIIIIV